MGHGLTWGAVAGPSSGRVFRYDVGRTTGRGEGGGVLQEDKIR